MGPTPRRTAAAERAAAAVPRDAGAGGGTGSGGGVVADGGIAGSDAGGRGAAGEGGLGGFGGAAGTSGTGGFTGGTGGSAGAGGGTGGQATGGGAGGGLGGGEGATGGGAGGATGGASGGGAGGGAVAGCTTGSGGGGTPGTGGLGGGAVGGNGGSAGAGGSTTCGWLVDRVPNPGFPGTRLGLSMDTAGYVFAAWFLATVVPIEKHELAVQMRPPGGAWTSLQTLFTGILFTPWDQQGAVNGLYVTGAKPFVLYADGSERPTVLTTAPQFPSGSANDWTCHRPPVVWPGQGSGIKTMGGSYVVSNAWHVRREQHPRPEQPGSAVLVRLSASG